MKQMSKKSFSYVLIAALFLVAASTGPVLADGSTTDLVANSSNAYNTLPGLIKQAVNSGLYSVPSVTGDPVLDLGSFFYGLLKAINMGEEVTAKVI